MTSYTHTIHLPQPLPQPFSSWDTNWQKWIESINTQTVRIKSRIRMPIMSKNGPPTYIDGYDIENSPPTSFVPWVNSAWLVPLSTSAERAALFEPYVEDSECTCDARDLFNFGCRGH